MPSEIKVGDTAPYFWDKFVRKYPITNISGVTYSPLPHGVPSRNMPIPPYVSEVLPEKIRRYQLKQWQPLKEGEVFAVGSLVHTWPWKEHRSNIGFVPMSVVLADFDLPNTSENKDRILSVLESSYKFCGWTLFDSGHSFHLVLDGLVKPEGLPWHYGKLINSFAKLEPELSWQVIDRVGDLQKCWCEPEKIRNFCGKTLELITHYDDPNPNGLHFPVDLRWVAHTLNELAVYLNGDRNKDFGFLRITGNPSPVVVAQYNR